MVGLGSDTSKSSQSSVSALTRLNVTSPPIPSSTLHTHSSADKRGSSASSSKGGSSAPRTRLPKSPTVRTTPSIVSVVWLGSTEESDAVRDWPTSVELNAQRCHREPTEHGELTAPKVVPPGTGFGLARWRQYSRCRVYGRSICFSIQLCSAESDVVLGVAAVACSICAASACTLSCVGPKVACIRKRAATF